MYSSIEIINFETNHIELYLFWIGIYTEINLYTYTEINFYTYTKMNLFTYTEMNFYTCT